MHKRITFLIVIISLTFIFILHSDKVASAQESAQLIIDRYIFAPNEDIRVNFMAEQDYAADAWIGIIPSNVPHGEESVADRYDLTYQYLNNRTSGYLIFKAPKEEGNYDLRMFNTDSNGMETASVSFQVRIGTSDYENKLDPNIPDKIHLDKNVFAPFEEIKLYFTARKEYDPSGWIGIIPSSVPHGEEEVADRYDIDYQYLNKSIVGIMYFVAPKDAGSYDFRMFTSDAAGKEVSYKSFQVVKGAFPGNTIKLIKHTVAPGEKMTVYFTADPSFPANAWIGIVPSSVYHGDEANNDKYDIAYQYLNKQDYGILVFYAPNAPGQYDFRMHDTDDNGKEVAYIMFLVR